MGRYYYTSKQTTESSYRIDIRKLKQWGYLKGTGYGNLVWTSNGWEEKKSFIYFSIDTICESPYINPQYTITNKESGEKEKFDYKIKLTWTKCNYKGKRWWFVCPVIDKYGFNCNKRVGVLYMPSGAKYFGCRHCYNLTYYSRNENHKGRLGFLGRMFDYDKKAEELYKKIKRFSYAGEPTKKYKKYLDLLDKVDINARISLATELKK